MEDFKKLTIAAYDKKARMFAEKFKTLFELKRRYEFPRFLELLPGKNVLDLGCGSGDHALHFSKEGLQVTCVDLSSEMVALCKEKGLQALQMDIEDLQFEDESFDGIWAVTSLVHVPKKDIAKVVTKLSHILKKEGVLYVCVKEGEGERLVDRDLPRFFAFWEEKELLSLFEKEFKVVEFKKEIVGERVFLEVFFKKRG